MRQSYQSISPHMIRWFTNRRVEFHINIICFSLPKSQIQQPGQLPHASKSDAAHILILKKAIFHFRWDGIVTCWYFVLRLLGDALRVSGCLSSWKHRPDHTHFLTLRLNSPLKYVSENIWGEKKGNAVTKSWFTFDQHRLMWRKTSEVGTTWREVWYWNESKLL